MSSQDWIFGLVISINIALIIRIIYKSQQEANIVHKQLVDRSTSVAQASRDAIDS